MPGQTSTDPEWADSTWMWDTVGRTARNQNTKPETAPRWGVAVEEAVEAAGVERLSQSHSIGAWCPRQRRSWVLCSGPGESGVQEPSWVREDGGAAGKVWGAPACRARDPTRGKFSEWGSGATRGPCLRGFRPGRNSTLMRLSPPLAPRHPQLSCLSPSPAGTGFCSPPGGRVPDDWSTPVSSSYSANQHAAVFSSRSRNKRAGIKGPEKTPAGPNTHE